MACRPFLISTQQLFTSLCNVPSIFWFLFDTFFAREQIIVIYWMKIISFIFHFTRDLCEGIIKVPREVKDKGNYHHPIRNFAWLQVFMPPKTWKKRVQKIKIDATQNNSVPLELGKQHHTGDKKEWLDRAAKFQPKFGHFQDHGGWVHHAKESTTETFWLVSHLPQVGGGF